MLVKAVVPFTEIDRLEKLGLLYAPDEAKERNTPLPNCGMVMLVGNECKYIQEGDLVLFSKFAGGEYSFDGETNFKILEESEILCTLEDTLGVIRPTAD